MNTPFISTRPLCALALVLLLPSASACAYHGGYGAHLGYAGHSGGHSSVHLGLSYDYHPGYYGGYYQPYYGPPSYYGLPPRIILRGAVGGYHHGHHFKRHGHHYRGFKHHGYKFRGFGHRRH